LEFKGRKEHIRGKSRQSNTAKKRPGGRWEGSLELKGVRRKSRVRGPCNDADKDGTSEAIARIARNGKR